MAENNNQAKPQGQGGQGQKNGNYQNRNRNYQNKNRNNRYNRPQQNNASQSQAQKGEEQQSKPQNKGGHKPHNRYKNRFEGKKLPAIETVEDIAADISRIEKEIELEIREIGTMTLG